MSNFLLQASATAPFSSLQSNVFYNVRKEENRNQVLGNYKLFSLPQQKVGRKANQASREWGSWSSQQLMPSHPPTGQILLVWVYLKSPSPKHTSWAIHHIITSLTTSHPYSSPASDQPDLNFPSAVEFMLLHLNASRTKKTPNKPPNKTKTLQVNQLWCLLSDFHL